MIWLSCSQIKIFISNLAVEVFKSYFDEHNTYLDLIFVNIIFAGEIDENKLRNDEIGFKLPVFGRLQFDECPQML